MNDKIFVILKSGLAATAVMTIMMLLAPIMGMPKMPIGEMLAGFMGMPVFLGWIMHFMIGIVLAGSYVFFLQTRLSGNDAVKGMLFSLIPFIMAQLIVMPMTGPGLFSSNTPVPMMMVMGSLAGHIVYGFILGLTAKPSAK